MAGPTLTERLKALRLEMQGADQGTPKTNRVSFLPLLYRLDENTDDRLTQRTVSSLGRQIFRKLSAGPSHRPRDEELTGGNVPRAPFIVTNFNDEQPPPPVEDGTLNERSKLVLSGQKTQQGTAPDAGQSVNGCASEDTSENWELLCAADTSSLPRAKLNKNGPKGPQNVEKVREEFLDIPLRGRGMIQQHEFLSKHTPFDASAGVRHNNCPGTLRKEQFEWHGKLGRGTFGTVFLVSDKATSFRCAAKVCWKCLMTSGKWLQREVQIHSQLDHPHIIKLYDHWQNEYETTLVLEFAPGRSLYDYIQGQPGNVLEEKVAAKCTLQLVSALQYIHSKGIIHRDVKSDNVLIGDKGLIKLCDFGWAVNAAPTGRRSSVHGTLDYRAPETIRETVMSNIVYDKRVDIWAVGCLLFEMLTGYCPFEDEDEVPIKVTFDKIAAVDYDIPDDLSKGASDLIGKVS